MADVQGAARAPDLDVVVVGAGFAGLHLLYKLRGLGFSVRVFETGDGVGGTWYWNRYPGARCDVESLQYSFGFSDELQQEWDWSERYSSQAEILAYLDHVADRFDLRKDIRLESRVTSAILEEATGLWRIETSKGEAVTARFCIMATGCLSAARVPDFPGLDSFGGRWFHTGRWPKEPVSFAGRRVAVPAPRAQRVFQRLFKQQRGSGMATPALSGGAGFEAGHRLSDHEALPADICRTCGGHVSSTVYVNHA